MHYLLHFFSFFFHFLILMSLSLEIQYILFQFLLCSAIKYIQLVILIRFEPKTQKVQYLLFAQPHIPQHISLLIDILDRYTVHFDNMFKKLLLTIILKVILSIHKNLGILGTETIFHELPDFFTVEA